jgi:hypothetical protein
LVCPQVTSLQLTRYTYETAEKTLRLHFQDDQTSISTTKTGRMAYPFSTPPVMTLAAGYPVRN